MATKTPDLQILDQWFALLDGAAGRGDEVLSRTKELLKERNYPGVSWDEEVVKSEGWIGGKKRVLLLVRNASMKDYVMYIGARDYGSDGGGCFIKCVKGFILNNPTLTHHEPKKKTPKQHLRFRSI